MEEEIDLSSWPGFLLPPAWVLGSFTMILIVSMSVMLALNRVEERQGGGAASQGMSPVSRLLDGQALHHVGLVVANLTRSRSFYVGVLGGREVALARQEAPDAQLGSLLGRPSDASFSSVAWKAVSFGSSQVFLWQSASPALQTPSHMQVAFRLGVTANISQFIDLIHERLRDFPELGTSQAGCVEHTALQPEWRIVACVGPDQEAVQFWQPNVHVAKLLEGARKDWASLASDPRGRDLFE